MTDIKGWAELVAKAGTQHGVVTWAQARKAGVHRSTYISKTVPVPGVALRGVRLLDAPPEDRRQADQQRAVCAVLAVEPDAFAGTPSVWASHDTAARVHKIWTCFDPPGLFTSVRADDARRHHRGVEVSHLALDEEDTEVVAGIPMTTVRRTVRDQLLTAPGPWGTVAVDCALHKGLLEPAAVRDLPGLTDKARRSIALADGRSESALESCGRLRLVAAGLAPDDLQFILPGTAAGREVRVDVVYLAPDGSVLFVVEFDGKAYHPGGDGSRDIAAERLLTDLQIPWRRYGWRDVLSDHKAMVADVRRCLARASTRPAA